MQRIPQSVITAFLTVLFIFVLLYAFAYTLGPLPISVNSVVTQKTDLFTVNGEGEATAVPDTASFTVGVTQNGSNAEAAQQQVTTTTNAIIDELKSLGVQDTDIKTQNYNVYPNRDFTRGETITGYTATQELAVKVDNVELANRALAAATANGANQISGVQFTIDDEDRMALEDKARRQAIDNAKKKAQSIADAAGLRLGRIISVQDSTAQQQPPIAFDRAAMGNAESIQMAQPDLQPGENTVHVTVSLSYETL